MMRTVKVRGDQLDIDLDDGQRTKMLMGHFPHGTSARSLNHLGQLIKTGEFREYDYKRNKNIEMYGEKVPPLIPLEDIKKSGIPLAIYGGQNDTVVPVEGPRQLMDIFMDQIDDSF